MRIESVLFPFLRWVIEHPRVAEGLFRFDSWGSPFADDFVADPMIRADQIRASGPVVWKPLYQQWFVTGYDEAREVLASPHVGTAEQVKVLLDVSPYTKMSQRARSFLQNFMLLTDPPQHTRLRGLVNRAFTPKQVSRLDERMAGIVDGLLERFPEGEVELMGDFATPFPAKIIAELFGLPEEDELWLRSVSPIITQMIDPFRAFDPDEITRVVDELHERIVALADERRANPKNDLITGLAMAEAEDGDRLSEDELVSVAGLILVAGHETTAGMIANSVVLLHDNPDQLDLVRSKPELWPNAVEELLRYDTSVRADPRTALVDFELAGHHIKAGQLIVVLAQLANRDFRRFSDADDLRLDRADPSPISFGHGIHYCLGANLARAELRAALPRVIDRLGDYHIDHNRIEWKRSITLRGPERLPITLG